MAELTRVAAERYGDATAATFQRDGEWVDADVRRAVGARSRDVALGPDRPRRRRRRPRRHPLQHPGRVHGRRPRRVVGRAPSSCRCTRRTRPTSASGCVGDSGAKVIVCEDAAQVAKIDRSAAGLPDLEHVVDHRRRRADGAVVDGRVAAGGAGGDAGELDRRAAAVGPDDACLIIYTSGTTGRPKGVVLTNKGFAAGRRSAIEMELFGRGDVVYLYLPLAHVFAQLIQADCIEVGAAIAYWGGDTTQIVAELGVVQADRAAVGARASSRRSTRWP